MSSLSTATTNAISAAVLAATRSSRLIHTVNLGTRPVRSGSFLLNARNHNLVVQADGPYPGKGTLADEAQMDAINVTSSQVNSQQIKCNWTSRTFVKGNFRFLSFSV
jgi:hypothetical protein